MAGATTNTGEPVDVLGYSSLLFGVQYISGGTTTVGLQGSHDSTFTNPFWLTAPTVPTVSAPAAIVIQSPPRYVRPAMVGVTAASYTASIIAR
jgi:hypothetical protein